MKLTLLISLATSVSALQTDEPFFIRNGPEFNITQVKVLPLDAGWFPFRFSRPGSRHRVKFGSRDPVRISVADAFCTGDAWDVLLNGRFFLRMAKVSESNCTKWTDDPEISFNDPEWSSVQFKLPPGKTKLELRTRISPFLGGVAFIKAESAPEVCAAQTEPFIVLSGEATTFEQIDQRCAFVDARPALSFRGNLTEAVSVMDKCGVSIAWSGDSDSYNGTWCTAISARNPRKPYMTKTAISALLTMILQAILALGLISLTSAQVTHEQIRNGSEGGLTKSVNMDIDGGWYRFRFGPSGSKTTFRANYSDWLLVSITDAFCPGESWDILGAGKYLVTTPRVPEDGCRAWTDDPNVAFWNATWSSTKFSLQGDLDLTLRSLDSPYKGGSAFIRFDSRLEICHKALSPFVMITQPRGGRNKTRSVCQRVNGGPANLNPSNIVQAAQSMVKCGINRAWFGRLSLTSPSSKANDEGHGSGCLALVIDDDRVATVEVADCTERLPSLCQN